MSKDFGEFRAVDGVSINVQAGEVLALLGQNGAGKTTTIRMLTSILRPTRGWARIVGYDVVRQAENVRASVGVLTEQHGLYLRMTGAEYLDFYGKVYRLDATTRQKRSAELLAYFGLDEFAHRPIGQYSKGMRQKLALARTLLHDPPALLLDEPTSAMDPESARLVREAIAGLRSANRAIIICTHNLVEAEMLADKIAIIYRGRILIQGTLSELRRSLLGPPEYDLILASPLPKRFEWPSHVTPLYPIENGYRLRIEHPTQSNPHLLRLLLDQGAQVIALQEKPHTLEEVYLAAMGQLAHD
ncbi:MAG: ABC transporter ATP-binding protein [Anaerolineales bacterium]|nr:ABC transporter ATP-binding protein [Anaerolineales bacterium]MDW8227528.1 ABC transporter ATP-binding protein [Anaerolineales bacterium]